jgi:hypothetical protein
MIAVDVIVMYTIAFLGTTDAQDHISPNAIATKVGEMFEYLGKQVDGWGDVSMRMGGTGMNNIQLKASTLFVRRGDFTN